jgi:hypothetical protein
MFGSFGFVNERVKMRFEQSPRRVLIDNPRKK